MSFFKIRLSSVYLPCVSQEDKMFPSYQHYWKIMQDLHKIFWKQIEISTLPENEFIFTPVMKIEK